MAGELRHRRVPSSEDGDGDGDGDGDEGVVVASSQRLDFASSSAANGNDNGKAGTSSGGGGGGGEGKEPRSGEKRDALGWLEWGRGWMAIVGEFLFQRIAASHLANPLELPPLDGVSIVVTGATSGIGLEMASATKLTGEGDAGAGDDAGLHDGVLLPGKGFEKSPQRSNAKVHVFMRKKARRSADMLSDGTMPEVRLSFMTMKLRNRPSAELTTTERTAICSDHAGRRSPSNAFSVDSASCAAASDPSDISYFDRSSSFVP